MLSLWCCSLKRIAFLVEPMCSGAETEKDRRIGRLEALGELLSNVMTASVDRDTDYESVG